MSTKSLFYPVCPIRGSVIFPKTPQLIQASRALSIQAIEAAISGDQYIITVSQKSEETDFPKEEDLYEVGTLCSVSRVRKNADGSLDVNISAIKRIRLKEIQYKDDYIIARAGDIRNYKESGMEFDALQSEMIDLFHGIVFESNKMPKELFVRVGKLDSASEKADFIASHMDFSVQQKQELLETARVSTRIRKLISFLEQENYLRELKNNIRQQVRDEIDKNQREYFLKEQIKVINKELGGNDETDEIDEIREKINGLGLTPEVKKEIDREVDRLSKIHGESAEAAVIRNYLNWVIDLPWNIRSEETINLKKTLEILDRDHYGLGKVKDRVLEFLAVRKLRNDRAQKEGTDATKKSSILIFTGPPGVGKTSIAQSIAQSLGREYIRIALGGIRDESDIRGHRRTYVGALPGRIIQGLRTAGKKNPVILLDEVDKVTRSSMGDPSSALLEVLDPAQNKYFTDHYLGVPFDLSEVLFIATANYPEEIPDALYDRMEIIEFNSYMEQEKLEIAKRYLVPKQLEESGLKASQVTFSEAALVRIISHYTREAGVRNLEREISKVLRKVAYEIATGKSKRVKITETTLDKYLGQPKHFPERENKENLVGISTGMFYTPVGGDILFVETSISEGKGFVLTGQLGDVMKESARAALSYAKINAKRFYIETNLDESEVHIHVPAGAIPKEGPSAGGAIASSLISALSGISVRHDVAMTGEMTLTGRYLAIGGLREKVLGARRAGIKHIILPKANEHDIDDIPSHLRAGLTFHPCDTLDEVLDVALVGGLAALQKPRTKKSKATPKTTRKKRVTKQQSNSNA